MISANIPNTTRIEVYRRDNFRCALCDYASFIQIHHVIPRGEGGSDDEHNLITLCQDCHAVIHGVLKPLWNKTKEEVVQDCIEYLADLYAGDWYPFK